MACAALALPLTVVAFVGVGAASAKTPKYTGNALGKVTCHGIGGKISLNPPLKNSTGGSSAKFLLKLSACTVSGLPAGVTETITKGTAKGTATEPGSGCGGLATGNTRPIALTVKWKGTFKDSTFSSGKAKFPLSTVTLKGFVAAFNGANDAGFEVPNPAAKPGGRVTGSFSGTVNNESTVYSNTNVNTLGSECGSKKGLKKLTLTSGTVSLP